MREIQLLERVSHVQSPYQSRVIRLDMQFKFRQHFCLVFDMLGADLYKDLKERKNELANTPGDKYARMYKIQIEKL